MTINIYTTALDIGVKVCYNKTTKRKGDKKNGK